MIALAPYIVAVLFLEPLPLERAWLVLLLPLVVAIAVIYKAIKIQNLSDLPRQVAVLTGQILGFMALAAVILWVLIEVV